MKLLKKVSNTDGSVEVKLFVSTTEDLWHLYNFILPGDTVTTVTKRKVTKENSIGMSQAQMKTLTLQIEVKSVDFTPDEIRIHGINRSESDFVQLGAHHSLTIHSFPPQEVKVCKKEWDSVVEERLKEACNQEGKADTAAVMMSFGEAQVFLVTSSLLYCKAKIDVTIAKKHKNDGTARDKSINRFFKQVLEAILTHVDFDKIKVVLICSPGHVREEFNAYMRQEATKSDNPRLHMLQQNLSKFVLVKVNSTTTGGLREAFSDPAVAMKMESTRCVSDIRVWDKFQSTMNKDPDLCVYTPQCVLSAAQAGAVVSLMVSDSVFRSENPVVRRFYLSLINFIKKQGGTSVNIFSSNHVTGEQLAQLGNVAAILQFTCPELDDIEVNPDFIDTEEVAEFIRDNYTTKTQN